jgi:phosphate-selective porin OprO/OprP
VRTSRAVVAAAGLFLAGPAATLHAQDQPQEQPARFVLTLPSSLALATAPDPAAPDVTFTFRDRPRLRFGDVLELELRAKLQVDFREYPPGLNDDDQGFELTRIRLGVQGRLFDRIEFEVEREVTDDERWWRDVFMDVRFSRELRVRAGKFKVPFGLNQMTSVTDQDFASRSRIGDLLSPGRSVGAQVYGRLGQRLQYFGGGFIHDGDNTRPRDAELDGRTLWAGRAVVEAIDGVHVAGNVTVGQVDEGLNETDYETASEFTFFEPLYLQGRRLRLGGDGRLRRGPASVTAEYARVEDERLGQGIGDDDLPVAIAQGWYVSGTLLLTGEEKDDNVRPRSDFLRGGIGAIEAAVRYEQIRFTSADHPDPPFRNPRAATVFPNGLRSWAFGVNWYLNRYGRILINAQRDSLEDDFHLWTPAPGQEYWTGVVRFQFAM